MTPNRHGEGWWGLDTLAYLLSPLRHLNGTFPRSIDIDDAIGWIRRTEVPWAPGSPDLTQEPWHALTGCPDDDAAIIHFLERAADDVKRARTAGGGEASAMEIVARKRLPVTTLTYALGFPPFDNGHSDGCADVHVHQGAALPVEVTLHWVASQITTIAEGVRGASRVLRDTDGVEFDPLPLLLALRAVVADHPDWPEALSIADAAAVEGGEAWDKLAALVTFDQPGDQPPDLESIVRLKERARHNWSPAQRHGLFRLEAALHGAVTQSVPGLDVFVDIFEDLASLRRGRFPKEKYYERSVEAHVDRTTSLRGLELRLGELVFGPKRPDAEALAREYHSALTGYLAFAQGSAEPLSVTFPLGLIKTTDDIAAGSAHWRVNPAGIYGVVEDLISVLERCPALVPFVDGLDVSGNELHAPNWLFAPAYRRFTEWSESRGHRTTVRFHAGEWFWTPLHGLRRIAEFLRFDLPVGARRRVGHALALRSNDWEMLARQPAAELLDDLLWAYDALERDALPGTRPAVTLERAIRDLTRLCYPALASRDLPELVAAYLARTNEEVLRRIGFLASDGASLTFPDYRPIPGGSAVDNVVVEMLRRRGERGFGPVGELTLRTGAFTQPVVAALRPLLSDLYALLTDTVADDLRWNGVVVESCPTSNVVVGGIRGYASHPAAAIAGGGVLVAVGSDDPAMFHSWAGDEHHVAAQYLGLHPRDARRSQALGLRLLPAPSRGSVLRDALAEAIGQIEAHYPTRG